MTDKKLTLKRLIIYLVISFLPFCIILPIMNAHYGEPVYMCEEAAAPVYALGVFGMMTPSAAHLITRLVTKEGFGNSYLGLKLAKNKRWYAASIVVKLIEAAICALLIWAVFMDMSFSEAFPSDNMNGKLGLTLLQLASALVVFFPAFGEEWGWRGYMMPKLTELMGRPAAVFVGGVLWGLWHAPLTISGHNFGTDYSFYPWLGILLMCVMCICMNAFLTLLTEKTHSIYPASFCHMVNNSFAGGVMIMIFGSEAAVLKLSEIPPVSAFLVCHPTLIVGVVSFILLLKHDKKNKAQIV